MPKLQWDQEGQKLYETGTSKGVLFTKDATGKSSGVAWNGLISVKQSPDGAEPTDLYADNIKYLSLESAENFKGSIDAYTYPDEFAACDGSAQITKGVTVGQQPRRQFDLVYSTIVGSDQEGGEYGEKLHIIYNAKATPSEKSYETINDSPTAITFSWSFTTVPVVSALEGVKPTAYVCINLHEIDETTKEVLLDTIYGTDELPAELPRLDALLTMLKA